MSSPPSARPATHTAVVHLGGDVARLLVERMRSEIDLRYESAEARASAWSSFLAMAGDWATDEGLQRPGAYQALKPIVEKLRGILPRPKAHKTLTAIKAVRPAGK